MWDDTYKKDKKKPESEKPEATTQNFMVFMQLQLLLLHQFLLKMGLINIIVSRDKAWLKSWISDTICEDREDGWKVAKRWKELEEQNTFLKSALSEAIRKVSHLEKQNNNFADKLTPEA